MAQHIVGVLEGDGLSLGVRVLLFVLWFLLNFVVCMCIVLCFAFQVLPRALWTVYILARLLIVKPSSLKGCFGSKCSPLGVAGGLAVVRLSHSAM